MSEPGQLPNFGDLTWTTSSDLEVFLKGYLGAGMIERLLLRVSIGTRQVQGDYKEDPDKYTPYQWIQKFTRAAALTLLEPQTKTKLTATVDLKQVILQSTFTAFNELN